MEIQKFIQLLLKRKYILLAVPLFAIGIAYFLVRRLPDIYTSKAILATGLVDQTDQFVLSNSQSESQESKINQQFSNIIQIMQLKKLLDQISYQLMIHDLSAKQPYLPPSKLLLQLNDDAKKHALAVFSELYRSGKSLDLENDDQKGLFKVLSSMGYDQQSLKKKLSIYRVSSSDYINIEFESPSPEFSEVVPNAICDITIKYYADVLNKSRTGAVNFLDSIIKQKKAVMDSQVLLLKNYKIDNRVLNLDEQAKSFYGLLADFETKREITKKDIDAYTGALRSINAKFDPKERKYFENSLISINQDIVNTKDILKQVNSDYIKSNFAAVYKAKVDSVKQLLVFQINQSNDKYIDNPFIAKQNLLLEKIRLEVELDIAKNSYNVLDAELLKLNVRFDKLVPHEAVIQSYEQTIDFASKEYIEILRKYNQTALESNAQSRLKQIEKSLPGVKLASKKMLLMVMAGFVSFILTLVVLFALFYFDDSISSTKELANKTSIATLGYLPLLNTNQLQLQQLWADKSPESLRYKNLLRDIRFEIDAELKDAKVLMVTSIKAKEGKTIFTLSLAYAYSIINKKVLVLDGNFTNPELTKIAQPAHYLDDYLLGKINIDQIKSNEQITVMGMHSSDVSLLEINSEPIITDKIAALKANYDIVIIELPALEHLNKAKEWVAFGDKLVSVFQASQTITPAKQEYVNYLQSLSPKFIGWVLTKTSDKKLKRQKVTT
ncbi:MAG: lipopolysaccharide biosynthesis protein [Deinococcales bacterium]|nr:lipopolysaccharide biosynthesis protein [Chitinophagaceae bacterium]